jgi:hypothetical protein
MARGEVAEYVLAILAWEGVVGEKGLLISAVQRWRDSPGLAFVDAYLAAVAAEDDSPIHTKNVKELQGQGADVPNPLPS